jgi:hypothetical protein
MVLCATICIDSDTLLSKQILGTEELGLAVILWCVRVAPLIIVGSGSLIINLLDNT